MKAIATALAVLSLALPLSACGARSHRIISGVFCAITIHSLYRDVRNHRLGWAAFQGLLAAHNCHQAFSRP